MELELLDYGKDGHGHFRLKDTRVRSFGEIGQAIGDQAIREGVWALHHMVSLVDVDFTGKIVDDKVVSVEYCGEFVVAGVQIGDTSKS